MGTYIFGITPNNFQNGTVELILTHMFGYY